MLQLVRFSKCIHILDSEQGQFVKSTARRVAIALGHPIRSGDHSVEHTRKKMLSEIVWVKCSGCSLGKKNRKAQLEHDHWIVGSNRV